MGHVGLPEGQVKYKLAKKDSCTEIGVSIYYIIVIIFYTPLSYRGIVQTHDRDLHKNSQCRGKKTYDICGIFFAILKSP